MSSRESASGRKCLKQITGMPLGYRSGVYDQEKGQCKFYSARNLYNLGDL